MTDRSFPGPACLCSCPRGCCIRWMPRQTSPYPCQPLAGVFPIHCGCAAPGATGAPDEATLVESPSGTSPACGSGWNLKVSAFPTEEVAAPAPVGPQPRRPPAPPVNQSGAAPDPCLIAAGVQLIWCWHRPATGTQQSIASPARFKHGPTKPCYHAPRLLDWATVHRQIPGPALSIPHSVSRCGRNRHVLCCGRASGQPSTSDAEGL